MIRAPAPEDDRAHGGDQQQHRGGLEGDQEALEQQVADLGRACRTPGWTVGPSVSSALSPVPRTAIESSTNSAAASSGARNRWPGIGSQIGSSTAADVGGDEDVEDHHRARVDDDLRRGDELGVQEQEEPGERDQVDDQREHAVEGVAQRDHRDRPAEGADRAGEEGDIDHARRLLRLAHSPSPRSGVRSIGSASSISLVKIRSSRL